MSFVVINTSEIASGEPVTATTLGKIKDNFDDHEERIEDLELATSTTIPINWRVNGYYCAVTDVLKVTANGAMTITGIRILSDIAGSAGTLEIDVLKKRGGGAFTSVLSTLPSLGFATGNDALSSNGAVDVTQAGLIAGDILRLDITSIQTDGRGFTVRVDYDRG